MNGKYVCHRHGGINYLWSSLVPEIRNPSVACMPEPSDRLKIVSTQALKQIFDVINKSPFITAITFEGLYGEGTCKLIFTHKDGTETVEYLGVPIDFLTDTQTEKSLSAFERLVSELTEKFLEIV